MKLQRVDVPDWLTELVDNFFDIATVAEAATLRHWCYEQLRCQERLLPTYLYLERGIRSYVDLRIPVVNPMPVGTVWDDAICKGKLLGSPVIIRPVAVVSLGCLALMGTLFRHGNVELLNQLIVRCQAALRRVMDVVRQRIPLHDMVRERHPKNGSFTIHWDEGHYLVIRATSVGVHEAQFAFTLRTLLQQLFYPLRIKLLE